MKKIAIFLALVCISFAFLSFQKNNIYEICQKGSFIELKSDYALKQAPVKNSAGGVYFEIKNSKLADNIKIDHTGDLGIMTQQIGSKTRIYLKGQSCEKFKIKFAPKKGGFPLDYGMISVFAGIMSLCCYVAMRFYSDTIRLSKEELKVTLPIKSAMDLNKQFYTFGKRKSPEIVLTKVTNPIHTEVYDFQYAKNKKNIKIAI